METHRWATQPPDSEINRAPAGLPVVIGEYVAPAGRRRLPAAFVRACPHCGASSMHRPVEQATITRRAGSCGHRYQLYVAAFDERSGAAVNA